MDGEKLLEASMDFDTYLVDFSLKYELPAILVTSIALARLVHLNKQFGDKADFIKLLNAITDTSVFDDTEQVTH